MPDPIARTYLSLGAFYASDPARRTSRERDVGLFWRSRSRARRSAPPGCATPASCTCSSTPWAAAAAAASTCSRRAHDERGARRAPRRLGGRLRPRGLARVAARAHGRAPSRTPSRRSRVARPAHSCAAAVTRPAVA